ncbi:MAG: plastocyanin/azurin family copper-binding protein, partial [Candidatus Limnocylindria bacterium]
MALRTVARVGLCGLALAILFSATADAASRTVAIQGFSFAPITIAVGDTVTWHDLDGVTHTATSDTKAFDTGPIAAGASSQAIPFTAAGTFAYHCSIHPFMHGTVTVQAAATPPPTPTPPPATAPPTRPPTVAPTASPSPNSTATPSPSASATSSPAPTIAPTPIASPTSV